MLLCMRKIFVSKVYLLREYHSFRYKLSFLSLENEITVRYFFALYVNFDAQKYVCIELPRISLLYF